MIKTIVVNDGLQGAKIGWIFFFLFLALSLYLLSLIFKERKMQNTRRNIRRLIEEGNRNQRAVSAAQDMQAAAADAAELKQIHERVKKEEAWEKEVREQARKDFRHFT